MTSFVLVHGAWHGAWCWDAVVAGLHDAGHDAHAPTLTGLGSRADELAGDVDVDVHARDVRELLDEAGLVDAVVVGHSYGTVPVIVAAAQDPARIRELVLLDGFVIEGGEAPIDLLPDRAAEHYRASAYDQHGVPVLPPRPLERLGVTNPRIIASVEPRLVVHPQSTYTSPVSVGASDVGVPVTFLQCTGWASPFDHMRTRATDLGWATGSIPGDHEVLLTDPDLLVEHLVDIATTSATHLQETIEP